MHSTYREYYVSLKNKLIFQYVCNNASALRIDIDSLKRFLRKMHTLDESIVTHNEEYIERTLVS
jgi:DNA helicase-4